MPTKTHVKFFSYVAFLVFCSLLLPSATSLNADTMSSSSFKITSDTMSVGGGRGTSSSFTVEDTLGEIATGEDLSSSSFKACAGYQCYLGAGFISFTLKEGTSSPGLSGAGVALGTLSPAAVKTSDGSTVNSIFITAASNAPGGNVITVVGANGGLKSASVGTDIITSSTATLTAGTAGFGMCVFSTSQDGSSPTAFNKVSPYNGSCDKTTNHSVGGVTTTAQTILSSSGVLLGGTAEILVKAAVSAISKAHPDYGETTTFIISSTF